MTIDFPLADAVSRRYSARNYSDLEIEELKLRAIRSFIDTLNNPFGKKVNFHLIDEDAFRGEGRLGTYGVIKGAKHYIGTTISPGPLALEAIGYELEAVILFLTHLGLGTCWLGGTFRRKEFARAMSIDENDLFPIITPYGYAAKSKRTTESIMRKIVRADQRKEWDKLFFRDDFQTPLTRKEAGIFEFPLETVRLGPSASNKQPWRLVLSGDICHFYEFSSPNYSSVFPYDIQSVDMGIAAAHFDLAVQEIGKKGSFTASVKPQIELPENCHYKFSWVEER